MGANQRDSSVHLRSAPTLYYYASKKLCAQLYEIDPRVKSLGNQPKWSKNWLSFLYNGDYGGRLIWKV